MGNQPAAKYVLDDRKTLKIIAWPTRAGDKLTYTIEKSSKDKEGEWQTTKLPGLWPEDIYALGKLARKVEQELSGAMETTQTAAPDSTIDDDEIPF